MISYWLFYVIARQCSTIVHLNSGNYLPILTIICRLTTSYFSKITVFVVILTTWQIARMITYILFSKEFVRCSLGTQLASIPLWQLFLRSFRTCRQPNWIVDSWAFSQTLTRGYNIMIRKSVEPLFGTNYWKRFFTLQFYRVAKWHTSTWL